MSLKTRLSAFFLAALAAVLVGFSAALLLLARSYLVGQLDERLGRALDTLEAAVDIEPGGLEWEPADRLIAVGIDRGENALGHFPFTTAANAAESSFSEYGFDSRSNLNASPEGSSA